MYPVSARFLDTITGSHRAVVRATALRTRQFVAVPVGGTVLPVLSGDVRLASTADINGTLDLSVPGDWWAEVQPYGVEIHVARGVDYGDGTSELVPLGYYRVDDVDQDSAPYGPIRISGSDRTAQMIQNRVLAPYPVPAGTTHRAIFERLVNGRPGPAGAGSQAGFGLGMFGTTIVPIVWASYDPDRAVVGSGLVVQDSTYGFLAKLADGQGCVLRFDELGQLRVEDRDPDPTSPSAYTIEIGRTGTLIRASRRVTRDGVYNIVSAYGSDPAFPTGYSQAYNADPSSPLYWKGPFGAAPRYYASPVLKTAEAAAEAAVTILGRSTGLPASHSLLAVPNPAVRPLDVLAARIGPVVQRFVLDSASIPLAGGSPVEIGTRTTNPVGVIVTDTSISPVPGPTPDPGGPPAVASSPGEALNIRAADGGNHVNIGVGFSPGSAFGTAATHRDFSQAEIEGGLIVPGYYEIETGTGMVLLTVPLDGGRTSTNTRYPRTEHRGLKPDGSKQSFNKGTRCYIRGRSSVEFKPGMSKPETVLAQFHDASDDTAMIHVRDGLVRAKIRGTYVATLEAAWDKAMKDWMIEVTAAGSINFYWGDMVTPAYTNNTFAGGFSGWYAKAGNYAQSWARSPGDTTSTRDGAGPTDTLAMSPIIVRTDPSKFELWQTGWAKPARLPGAGGATPPPPTTVDGTQAAVTLGWGAVQDGDEFEYTGSPGGRWTMYDGPGHAGNGLRRPSAFSVANGVMTCYGNSSGTTGGMAFNRDEKYCRLEVRARTYSLNPGGSGNRYHPVLITWPTSDRWPQDGENDFFETDCDSGKLGWFIHIPGNDGSAQHGDTQALDIQNWHNYAFEWDRNGTRGFVDGVKYFDYSDIHPPGTMHLTFQLDAFYSGGFEPAKFEAQWVRIYQRPS